MKKLFVIVLLAALPVFFLGCPYNSKVAIDSKPIVKIDERMIGTWGITDTAITYYEIGKLNDNEYLIKEYSKDKDNVAKVTSKYSAFISEINNVTFLNVKQLPEKDDFSLFGEEYYFYKIVLEPGVIISTPVTNFIKEEFTSSEALRSFFAENMKNSYFFQEDSRYIKIK